MRWTHTYAHNAQTKIGRVLNGKVLRALHCDSEPKTRRQAIKYIRFIEYIKNNPPMGLGESPDMYTVEEWEAMNTQKIEDTKYKWSLWHVSQ